MNEIWTLILLLWVVLVLLLGWGQYVHFKRHGRLYYWNDPEFDPEETDYDALLPVDRERAKNEVWMRIKNGHAISAKQQKLLNLTDAALDDLIEVYGGKPRVKQEQSQ